MDDFKLFAAISYARTYDTVAMHHVRKGAGRKIHACANVVERS